MSYPVPAREHISELEVKRSRFITFLDQAGDREQTLAYIARVRALHPQARHVCWAYIAGPPDTTVLSMSDDGEPSGTAGRPMLAALQHSGLGEVVVAVVRYFGGIKLGTGGLQRAYSDAVVSVLADCDTRDRIPTWQAFLQIDFADESPVRRLLNELDGEIIDLNYSLSVDMTVSLPAIEQERFRECLDSLTSGRVRLSESP